MPRPLDPELVAPERTAIVTQECQNGVVGAQTHLQALAEEAQREAIPNIVRLVQAGRAAGVSVVHCTVQSRADRRGSNHNAPIFGIGESGRAATMTPDSVAATVLAELGPADTDLVLPRWHGIGPMGGTELDAVLRNLGVTTIVGVGVSVNIAITNFAMDAVNIGYHFVLPRDAVAGIPREYAESIIRHTLSFITTITTTDTLIDAWS